MATTWSGTSNINVQDIKDCAWKLISNFLTTFPSLASFLLMLIIKLTIISIFYNKCLAFSDQRIPHIAKPEAVQICKALIIVIGVSKLC